MLSDSISIVATAMASSNQKDLARKRRGNRSAKLKQCKLDARREQWLSQVKNKVCKDDLDGDGGFSGKNLHTQESDQSVENLVIKKQRGRPNQISVHDYSDSDPHSNSPTSHTSSVSDSKSGTSFTSSGGSNSSSSVGSCSGSVTGEDELVDDGCLDDWETVADALASLDCKQEHKSCSELSLGQGNIDNPNTGYGVSIQYHKPSLEPMETPQRAQEIGRAWKPDDVSRPRSLPKQFSFPIKAEKHYAHGANSCGCGEDVISSPSSCPICCEDLDFTDSSFLPCSCGFRLCLFCHKMILENDGRCPGCRKRYDNDCLKGEATFMGTVMTTRMANSFSMIAKS